MTCAYEHDHTDGLCTMDAVYIRLKDWYYGIILMDIPRYGWATVLGW